MRWAALLASGKQPRRTHAASPHSFTFATCNVTPGPRKLIGHGPALLFHSHQSKTERLLPFMMSSKKSPNVAAVPPQPTYGYTQPVTVPAAQPPMPGPAAAGAANTGVARPRSPFRPARRPGSHSSAVRAAANFENAQGPCISALTVQSPRFQFFFPGQSPRCQGTSSGARSRCIGNQAVSTSSDASSRKINHKRHTATTDYSGT